MTVEGMKKVLVWVGLDDSSKELLDWAMVKFANFGDSVVAIHVCKNMDGFSCKKKLLDGYLEDYEGLCNQKQVALTAEVLKGNSVRKVIAREAKNHSASTVVVGITKYSGLIRGWTSIAKYCAKKLPPTTEIIAVDNGKVVFSRCSKIPLQDPKPKDTAHSEFGESETSSFSDGKESKNKGSLHSISLPAEDFTSQRPGWPLLQTSISLTQESLESRSMSIVQWVMSLPNRSPSSETELPKDLENILTRNTGGCQVFSHDDLKMSTSEFSSGNLIAKGGCTSVYKGILPDGKPIAVKILESSEEALRNFVQEVDIMTTLEHERVAPMLGVCVGENNLFSVSNFMSKGNLEQNLRGDKKDKSLLSWESRFRIAVGIAEGINYLHNKCPRPVIHRDIKSSNILLTEELEPQLCDFGLAIWGPTTTPFMMDNDVVGTFGYLAPEYFMYGKVSDKVDVYAFGVVLLELLSGKESIGSEKDKGQESLVMWAKPKLGNRDFTSILDPNLGGDVDDARMQRMGLAAASCLTQSSRLRPKMFQILNILHGEDYTVCEDNEDDEYDDAEVYPESTANSHLSLAFLDVNESSTSFSSLDQSSPLSVEDYVKKRWSRSSSYRLD